MTSVSPALPKKERRYRKRRLREQQEIPPEIPAKGKQSLSLSIYLNTQGLEIDYTFFFKHFMFDLSECLCLNVTQSVTEDIMTTL